MKNNKIFLPLQWSNFAILLALLKHEVNNRGFISECIQWWPVIISVTLIHGYSHLVSLENVVGYKKLRHFQGTQFNPIVLLEKKNITYRGALNTESLHPSCIISSRTRTMLKILYFSGGYQLFQISPGIKSLYDRGRKRIDLLMGRHNLGPGR